MTVTISIVADTADTARHELMRLLGAYAPIFYADGDPAGGAAPVFEAEPVPEAGEVEPPKRGRGRPRKAPEVIDATANAEEPGRIESPADTVAVDAASEELVAAEPEAALLPAEPEGGWTEAHAKDAARTLLAGFPPGAQGEADGRTALFSRLQKFGVARVKDVPAERLGEFVAACQKKDA